MARRFADYCGRLGQEVDLSDVAPGPLAYQVAASMVLAERDRQELLEAPDTAARLQAELALLSQENALLDAFTSLPGVELSRAPFSPN